jgi:streptogramin lyase
MAADKQRSRRVGLLAAGFAVLALFLPANALAVGSITEFKAGLDAGSFPLHIVIGPDGNVWFTNPASAGGTPAIGRVTPSGTITEFSAGLQAHSNPDRIVVGPDGNLWFTDVGVEGSTPAIGRITPSGTITEFTTGVNQDGHTIGLREPSGIAVGPDGNLWFTDSTDFFSTDKSGVGKITPGGSITEYELPSACTTPANILSGPDGNLWFISGAKGPFCGGIGRVTPSGTITEFEATFNSGAGSPRSLTLGPDGNLWFTSTKGINRITTGGVITTYTDNLPTELNLGRIITGPDGNLWFTDSEHIGGPSAIGRVTLSGTITEFPMPDPDHNRIEDLVVGPDGNIWFNDKDVEGEPGSSAIGRISPSGQVTMFSFGLGLYSQPTALTVGPGNANIWFTAPSNTANVSAIDRVASVSAPSTSPNPTLIVRLAGQGTVASTPGGIACGATCEATFPSSTAISLTASPAPGYKFIGWNEDCELGSCESWAGQHGRQQCRESGSCNVTLNSDTEISAVFAPTTASDTSGGGSSSPPASSTPSPTNQPSSSRKPKPLKCRKGFKKQKVHGKARCVKIKNRR